jgi:hypothetical protein
MLSPKIIATATLLAAVIGITLVVTGTTGIVKEDSRIWLVDRTGERWDITQAVSLGFEPGGFQFGIGRNAIRPLDDNSLRSGEGDIHVGTRVIGVRNGPDAHAYVVRKLTRHEIANTTLGDMPIAAAY